ncbi:very short patch repair endonuclease [Nitrosopumilus sp.]|uniref:very short patch repair endonuclease n=1 Tax=Nitrosopumilus sp. TaxID=2024843 RepID=UPI003D149953
MTDIFSKEKRSWVMSRIRSKNTSIDLKMKDMLSAINCNFTMYPKMHGNPDFVLDEKKIAIFCDGDFWHGYRYFEKKKPAKAYWKNKIETNMKRDKKISRELRKEGWSVLRFWEHDLNKRNQVCINKILKKIHERQQ